MVNWIWRGIPGGDTVNKVSFISAILGIAGFGLYLYDSTRDDTADRVARDQVIRLAEQLIGGKAQAAAPPSAAAGQIELLSSSDQITKVKLGDHELKLTPPPGQCFLDASQPGDARMIGVLNQMFQADIRLLAGYADCAQLKLWRTGQRKVLDDYGQYVVPLSVLTFTYQGETDALVKEFCGVMRKQGDSLMSQVDASVKNRVSTAIANAKINEMKFLGVIGEDKNACHYAILQKLTTEFGDAKTQIGVIATVFAGGKVFNSNLYGLHEGDLSMPELLEKQRGGIARILGVN